MVEQIPGIVYITEFGERGDWLYVSPRIKSVLGYSPEEWLVHSAPFHTFVHPEDRERVDASELAAGLAGEVFETEYRVFARDGGVVWIRDHAMVVRDSGGQPTFLQGVMYDITEQMRGEDERRRLQAAVESQQRIGDVLENLQMFAVSVDAAGRLTYCNRNFLNVTGWEREEVLGQDWSEMFLPPEHRHAWESLILRVGDEPALPHDDHAILCRSGTTRLISWDHAVMRDSLGAVVGVTSVGQDVTERKREEEKLLEAEAKYRNLVEQIPAVTYIDALDGCVTSYVSPQYCQLLGYTPEERTADPDLWSRLLHPDDRARALAASDRSDRTGEPFSLEYRMIARDGRVVWLHDEAYLVRDDEGGPIFWQGVLFDITERMEAEQQIQHAEAKFRTVFQGAAIGIATVDTQANLIQVNEAAGGLFGYAPDELIGMPLATLLDSDDGGFLRQFGELVQGDIRRYEMEHRFRRKDDGVMWGQVAISLVRDEDGEPGFAILMVQDVTDRKRFEEELTHRALHDGLTGLPNRDVFLDRLAVALARMRRHDGRLAVIFLDLDRFKEVNDGMGHEAGDQLLIELGRRLTESVRPSDTVARFGGDEFAILCEDLRSDGLAEELARRVLSVLTEPTTVESREIFSTASLGVVLVADPDAAPQDLLRNADTAMYQAKRRGGNRFELFESSMTVEAQSRLEVGGRLRSALRAGEFELFYQPIVSMGTGRAVHVEALLRWRHPERGLVLPGEFIPIAVESGFIVPLGMWVLEEAVQQLDRWDRTLTSRPEIGVSVNVSARQFVDADLPSEVDRLIRETGIAPDRLCLEITEDVLLDDADQVSAVLRDLDGLGVTIAVDDFGTGYSSLGYLRRLPVDFLKVDRTFVSGVCDDRGDTELVAGIVAMGHALGLRIVAEGVETAEQLAQLRLLGCDLVQGFLLGRPSPPLEISTMLEEDPQPATEMTSLNAPAGRL